MKKFLFVATDETTINHPPSSGYIGVIQEGGEHLQTGIEFELASDESVTQFADSFQNYIVLRSKSRINIYSDSTEKPVKLIAHFEIDTSIIHSFKLLDLHLFVCMTLNGVLSVFMIKENEEHLLLLNTINLASSKIPLIASSQFEV